MKKILLCFFAGAAIVSCNNQATVSDETTEDSAAVSAQPTSMNYPYTIEHPDYWDIGSNENTMVALSALKAYENGNIDETMKYFGDSVHIEFNGIDATVSNDSLKQMFAQNRANVKSMEIKMNDWESVISKDKDLEYVSIWYKEIWEDANGKKDSLAQMDDVKIKNGKIVGLDEKSRKYPAK